MNRFTEAFRVLRRKKTTHNKYLETFLSLLGSGYTSYDDNSKTYLEDGYGLNPDVYAIIQQMSTKTISIPYCVKRIKDDQSKSKLDRLRKIYKTTIHNTAIFKKQSFRN